ncbi:glycosyl transferase [Komagataeibacter nataicola]|uniref:Glycosyl transferase n=1 Tax=Komagataeibacter nataicola TaxID=265960 RepID=A0A9N7H1A7_9PROT|nr:glycosyltransferase family 2 protein [Komagataeibacter nataicola]AQU88049.1 glycosyl transferase [Komagataeibacter nataicola]PYD65053.1 glycosyl transferase [Komagataeibacter nataicola]WEQ54855.1 glycosyltransferase family 2 protein [Komagataeibacter nataicola]WNM09192.1 glycosyltransferase family 2 protein [Komagataeibacter nataicola]GBR14442.1 glycosyltransferase [Komagataeibacter nataicola NRIC 0616]
MNIAAPWMATDQTAFAFKHRRRKPADLVSLCVTNFNYGRYIIEALDSLAAQTHPALELVVVDDCSDKDDSVALITAWMEENHARFWRCTLVVHTRNLGPSAARNTAFRHAGGVFVFVMDADNMIYPRAIARLHEAAVDGGFDATYCQLEYFGKEQRIGSADIWDPAQIVRENYVDVMALLRREAWVAVDGYSHIDEGWEDYDFWLKFIDRDFQAAYVPEILCRYRVHGNSRTTNEAWVAHESLRAIMAFRHPALSARYRQSPAAARP